MNAEDAIELLKKMIAVPSVSRNEKAVADMLQGEVEKLGYSVNRHINNLWVKSSGWDPEKPTILLDAHIDTVKPADGWLTDPFTPITDGERLTGLGSNDTGGSVVSLLTAFTVMDKAERDYNLIWLASTEEEVTGENGIRSVLKVLPKIDLAIVGEPTGMQPAVGERGLLVLDCKAYGKAGHAARNEGINAIYKAMKDMEWFRTYTFPKVSEDLGPVKMSVTGVNAGSLHNVVPAECSFMVDVRVNEFYSVREVYDEICSRVDCEVKARSFNHNSSNIDRNHPLVRKCVAMGLKPFGSPTTSNMTAMDFPSLKIGPGDSARSHTANEYIEFNEIREAVGIYVKLLDGLSI